MFIFSVIIFMIGILLYIEGKSDTWLPTDEEMYGFLMLFIGGVMFFFTGLIYWKAKE